MQKFAERAKALVWLWLPMVMTLVIVLFFPLMYLTEDDTMLNSVVADASVQGSEYFNYCGVVLGRILRPLYLCFPALNWYAILLFFFMTGSFCIFMFLLKNAERESGREQKLLYTVGMGICFVLHAYNLLHISFTNAAFFATLSGGMLFLSQKPPYDKKNIAISVFSLLWFAIGVSFRTNAGKPAAILLIVFVLIRLFETKVKLPIFFLVFVVALFGWYAHIKTQYPAEQTSPLYEYRQFDTVRGALVDRTQISYEENQEQLEKIGITKEDLNLYYQWWFADYNVFHPETFGKTMKTILKENPPAGPSLGRVLKAMFTSVINLAYLGFLFVVFLLGKKKNRLWMFFSCGCGAGMILMLLLRGRLLWRVQLAVMQLGLLLVLFTLLRGDNYIPSVIFPFKKKPWMQNLSVVLVCVLAVGVIAMRNNGIIAEQKAIQEGYAPIKSYLQEERASGKRFVSLVEHRTHFYYPEISFLKNTEVPYFVNVGEADVFHPHWKHTLEQCGFSEYNDSIFRALIDGEGVFAFTDDLSDMETAELFLERHYAEQVDWQIDEQIGNWYIGSFYTTD